jgi:hypothetical protein
MSHVMPKALKSFSKPVSSNPLLLLKNRFLRAAPTAFENWPGPILPVLKSDRTEFNHFIQILMKAEFSQVNTLYIVKHCEKYIHEKLSTPKREKDALGEKRIQSLMSQTFFLDQGRRKGKYVFFPGILNNSFQFLQNRQDYPQ